MFHRQPPPALTFVLEQMALERPIGGRQVLRRQLENLLDLGRLRTVEIQVGPQPRESRVFIDNLLGET
ncbi:Scr1 family TA system antitoxin-like transcriptional regulator [Streptomyces sp. NBC_00503]|uniref:Scr1 family TA system antitoxin-like transcriptional regulator n=1 Tax=Streptomyces sp. NBC_00503 TaxID=2903659 RepID=UPI002E80BC20|nr:Scr1 family TA system antitoxin-like transcriptional regulator [Streptomyces sp. NBC_00503]